jgi:UDPglucose 6-dehydrogenase
MNILICGYGFVGKAHALFLSSNHNVNVYDPALGHNETMHFGYGADAVIIAVSTPESDDGSCDMRNVYDCIERVPDETPILIKSTISLEGWRLIKRAFPDKQVTFSPEYLRAAYAMEDFRNQSEITIGGGDTNFWLELLTNSLGIYIVVEEPELLILTKYFRNTFLATKVAFFNQMYDMAQASGVNPGELLGMVSDDPRIGDSHTYVDPEDRGFGGHCFPKDTSALLKSGHEIGCDLSILSEAMQYNERIRNE